MQKDFYENLYIESQVLYLLIAILIIQMLSNTPRANWEMLKNEKKMHVQLERLHLQEFYHTLSCSMFHLKKEKKKKTFPP